MEWNFFRELGRKTVHLMILIVLAGYLVLLKEYGKTYALMALVLLLLIFLVIEYIRLELGVKMPFLDFFIRPKEVNRVSGAIYFISATIICLGVFEFRIALAALLMTTFGDMFAAVIGQRYGHTLIFKKKTLVGGVAELCVNLIIGMVVLLSHTNIYTVIMMAFAATISEVLVEDIDDNLIVPLVSGFIGQLLFML